MIQSVLAPNPGPFTLDGTRTWVIGDHTVIDPGPIALSHLEAILRAAPRLERILITHRHGDHAPGAFELKRRSGATIAAPPGALDAAAIDRRLTDGETIDAGELQLEAIATPGHTREHFCFLSSRGDLFTGDTVLGEGTTVIFPPDGDMGAYLASLRKLKERAPKRIYPGHGPIREDAIEWIDYYISHRLERERQIVEQLTGGPMSIPLLREIIYPDLAPRLERAAELQMEAHLEHLARHRRVMRSGSVWWLAG